MSYDNTFSPLKRTKKAPYDLSNKEDNDINIRSSLNKKNTYSNGNNFNKQKIKSNPSFSLQKPSNTAQKNSFQLSKTSVLPSDLSKDLVKLPALQRRNTTNTNNPQTSTLSPIKNKRLQYAQEKQQKVGVYYQKKLQRSLSKHETTYMMNLYRQHFYQTIQILRFGKEFRVPNPKKIMNFPKKNPQFKTIYLDLDQTLIHCDQRSNNYSVKLNFPLQRGGVIAAGVRIRSYCKQFLQELSKFAQIIIFTASSQSYADVILDYIDPKKQLISYRMYRQHCTLQKGFYLKDLRTGGRQLESCALVDNSAYCHILQPQNAIPIVPFFHFAKDRELESLLEYLKVLVKQTDLRTMLKNTFFFSKYIEDPRDARKVYLNNIQKMEDNLQQFFDVSGN